MSAALAGFEQADFEWMPRDIVMAIRCVSGVTGAPIRIPVDMEALGTNAAQLRWFAKPDGVQIVEAAPPGPLSLVLRPRSSAYAPRRVLIPPFAARVLNEPDPRSRPVDVSLTPTTSYPVTTNATLFVCRVVRQSDKAVIANALVRLMRAGSLQPIASAVTNKAGEALVISADIALFNSASTTVSRVSAFRLEAIVSLETAPNLPLDPDGLAAVMMDNARAMAVTRTLELTAGQSNPTVTLELEFSN